MQTSTIEDTFEQIYIQLVKFSEKIQVIQNLSYRITGKLQEPLPKQWTAFNHFFNSGMYYHYRCQGYVECLLVTDAYSSDSINIWINELVYPAAENFTQAMMYFEQIESTADIIKLQEFATVKQQMKEFQQIAMLIIQYANQLNTTTPPFKM
ncbi:hypothetical protein CSV79_01370 [Sporosarcina sp. P13]|uniref:hypothetical protein n=1 Tax=Sporosarcina sp. P13 TaxID=2048263 RepID=UPI000C166AB2|nr:hypothetical protein [Sporosarcina sp. P13]PIC65300.1 hypothetical protein CSV79_01370 [Sporosarcina sp. P13]